ncbi:MAG: hypothetical protein ACREU3_18895, partial [Steroidobacteraceae bacterium]
MLTENRNARNDAEVKRELAPPESAAPAPQAPDAQARPAALWTFAFRPFFLAASLWSVIAIVVWIVMLATGAELPSRF